ncbi:3-methyladenine DNA glycosylase [Companilactobacillus sp. RD055328]|uniref:DNA-3-methyladenine glycosylase I n=1 Tax=Companilactobacillus sp. RD055328 TaxID=2916634 RepID=UPI001FC83A75|nr:DNA-3-methyladenine glycosylase I [Companilactobacillus sp. RD055328]GKQ43239.1 3-methyladenine DNA glycosylase [Companilactobacillus sp. RD055328]
MTNRCEWAEASDNMREYHDKEWGVIEHDDHYLYEMLMLELFQSGLSWQTILNKRDNFRSAFDNFDIEIIKDYNDNKVSTLMRDTGIIRNKLKINAAIVNARMISDMHKNNQTFDSFVWSFTNKKRIMNHYQTSSEVPSFDELSTEISKAMKKRGFKFVGPTTIYSFLQASGVINDHIDSCDFK